MGTSSSSMSSGNSGNFGTRNAQYNNPDEAEQYSNSSNHPYHTMINENDAAAFMRNMRTQTIGDANRSYMDFYSRVSQTSMLRESWNEQTEPLTSRDESYLSTDDSGSTTSTIASLPASENFSSIQTQSTQSVNEDTEKLFLEGQETNSGCKSTSASFEPESLVGHELNIPSIGTGTINKYLHQEDTTFYYLLQMRDGRKIVIPFCINNGMSLEKPEDVRILSKIY